MSIYFSIITINYNNNVGLISTINSVNKQSKSYFEFIVIDGGSLDGSVETIKKNQQYIDFWISEPDLGIYDAMNKGIAKSTGKYLFFLNSGDIFFSYNVLKDVFSMNCNSDLLAGNVILIDKVNSISKIWKTKSNYKFSDVAFGHIPHQGFFFHYSLFIKYGLYNINNRIVSDWEYLLKLIYNNVSIDYLDLNFAIHYLDGISHKVEYLSLQEFEREEVLKKYISIYEDIYELKKSWNFLQFIKQKIRNLYNKARLFY